MPSRPQFSVSSLLLLTALIAFLLGSYQWQPTYLSIATRGALVVFAGSVAVVGCCSTDGIARAFWIGVAIPLAMSCFVICGNVPYLLIHLPSDFHAEASLETGAIALKTIIPLLWAAPINGIFCALAYWLLWRRSPSVDAPGRDSKR